MRSMKLLAIMLAVSIVLSLTTSAHAANVTIVPSFGPIGTHVTVTVPGAFFSPDDTSCTVSSSPNGLISNPTCLLSGGGGEQSASASFTVACAPAGEYAVTVTGNRGDYAGPVSFDNEGGPCPAVGGVVMPANTLAILTPWLAVIGLVTCIGTVVVVAKKK